VNRWWLLAKDVLLTGTGLVVIFSQDVSAHPSGLLLGTGLALTVPTIAEHVKALLPTSGGDGSSSESRSAPTPPPSPPSQQEESGGE